jgi:methionine aminotransferase
MSKLPKMGTTIFSVMSQMASEFNAVNLSQGFPNFPVDPKLKEILIEKTKQDVHQYAPMAG